MDAIEEYLFDLYGYTLIPEALDRDHVAAINAWIDALPPLDPDNTQPNAPPQHDAGQWIGNVYTQSYGKVDGINLQDIIEAGEQFERLIDHPAWIDAVRHFIGPTSKPYIHEIFASVRQPGGYIWPHSGGHAADHNQRAGRRNLQWVCTYLSLLVPLTDVGPGDGATVVVPGSHKSDIAHPQTHDGGASASAPSEALAGSVEIHLKAGDAVLFNDALLHGSAKRTNPGQRRMLTIRYVPATYAHRFGYTPSAELAARLTPQRLAIVQPMPPRRRPT
jgi:hypothetical protein